MTFIYNIKRLDGNHFKKEGLHFIHMSYPRAKSFWTKDNTHRWRKKKGLKLLKREKERRDSMAGGCYFSFRLLGHLSLSLFSFTVLNTKGMLRRESDRVNARARATKTHSTRIMYAKKNDRKGQGWKKWNRSGVWTPTSFIYFFLLFNISFFLKKILFFLLPLSLMNFGARLKSWRKISRKFL